MKRPANRRRREYGVERFLRASTVAAGCFAFLCALAAGWGAATGHWVNAFGWAMNCATLTWLSASFWSQRRRWQELRIRRCEQCGRAAGEDGYAVVLSPRPLCAPHALDAEATRRIDAALSEAGVG